VGQHLANDLTSRGLSRSPVAGTADEQLQQGRAANIADFQGNIPLVNRQLQNQDLGLAAAFLQGGRGTTGTGQQTSGGGVGGSFDSVAQMLGYLYGKGAFGKQKYGGVDSYTGG
jgi:hypothetical protein